MGYTYILMKCKEIQNLVDRLSNDQLLYYYILTPSRCARMIFKSKVVARWKGIRSSFHKKIVQKGKLQSHVKYMAGTYSEGTKERLSQKEPANIFSSGTKGSSIDS